MYINYQIHALRNILISSLIWVELFRIIFSNPEAISNLNKEHNKLSVSLHKWYLAESPTTGLLAYRVSCLLF